VQAQVPHRTLDPGGKYRREAPGQRRRAKQLAPDFLVVDQFAQLRQIRDGAGQRRLPLIAAVQAAIEAAAGFHGLAPAAPNVPHAQAGVAVAQPQCGRVEIGVGQGMLVRRRRALSVEQRMAQQRLAHFSIDQQREFDFHRDYPGSVKPFRWTIPLSAKCVDATRQPSERKVKYSNILSRNFTFVATLVKQFCVSG
jgi:hypothetical protein